MSRELVRDMASYLPAQVVPALMAFFSIPILTHFFSPSDYGNYVLVLGAVTLLTSLTGLFLMPIVRFYPSCEKAGQQDEFYNTVLATNVLLTLGLALPCALLLVLLRPSLPHGSLRLLWAGTLLFICQSIFLILPELFRAQRRIALYSGLLIWRSVFGVGLALVLVLVFRVGIDGFIWGMILSMVLAFPLAWKPALNRVPLNPARFSWKLGKEMMDYGLPLVVGNLFSRVIFLSDRYVLGIFRSSQEVGIYSANYDISDRTIMLMTMLFTLTSGSMAFHIWEKEGERKSREFSSDLTRLYLLVGMPAGAGLSVLARPLIQVMTSSEYWEGARIIPVVVLGVFLYGLQQRFQIGLLFYRKTGVIMRLIMAAGVANVLFNVLLIPKYGYSAAAYITLFSYLLLLVMMVFFSRRHFIWEFPWRSFFRIAGACFLMGTVLLLFEQIYPVVGTWALLAHVGIGVVTYGGALFLLREMKESEARAIFAFWSRIFGR